MSRRLALIIGNSEYEDRNLAKLVTPEADVHAFAQVLRDGEIGRFDEVVELVDQPSTAIRRAVSSFFVSRQRDDLLLLYFSGHGIKDDRGQLFLAAKDTEYNLLRGTAIAAAFITEEMDNSRSRQQVLILDCCHSGAFSRGMKAAPGASVGTAAAFEGTGSGRVVLTASDSTQYAWEGDQVIGKAENSVFTHYLIQGLRTGEADTAGDGRITLDELYDYVYEQVIHATPKQTPSKWSYGQKGEIVIASNPHPVVKPVELPTDLQETIEDPRPWVREGALRELDRIVRGSSLGLALVAHAALKRLADDDSRRVATMASEFLATYEKEQRITEQTEANRNTKQPAEYRTSELEEQGQLAREKLRARAAQQTLGTFKKVQQERPVEERARQPVGAISSATLQEQRRSQTRSVPYWAGVLLIAIGWAVDTQMFISNLDVSMLIGSVGGLVIGLTLWWREPSFQWKQILLITFGWIISGALLSQISVAQAFAGGPFGAIGGLITGLALRWHYQSIQWQQVLRITLGWILGMALLWFIAGGFGWAGRLVGGPIGGVIGSSIMFRTVAKAHHLHEKAGQ